MSSDQNKSMTNEVRNRIVGGVILLIAALVILPSLISFEQISNKNEFKSVPVKPKFEVIKSDQAFPDQKFEQHQPQAQALSNEQPLDHQADQSRLVSNDDQVASYPLEEQSQATATDGLTINTLEKPQDFLTPQQLQARKRQQEITQGSLSQSSNIVVNRRNQSQEINTEANSFTTQAWVIQLGSFKNKANARAMEKRLNNAGFTTFNREIASSHGLLTKVYVGPELDRKILQNTLATVNQVAKVEGIITKFTIKR